MAPLTPHWEQPSHPSIQKVLLTSNKEEFTSKSVSTIDVAPFGVYAKLDFPPCTRTDTPTYATVQMGKDEHLNLNSDLVYVNHSCEPSVIFDTSSLSILAGPNGLHKDEELTFFYPSTEWNMAQGFNCFCGSANCKGWIDGARNMTAKQLRGMWLNTHIRELLEERDSKRENATVNINGSKDATEEALKANLEMARKMIIAAEKALNTYYNSRHGAYAENGINSGAGGDVRRGVTSREMSGEMGGDTRIEV